MPQISVIVPVYKVETYIHRCVDSILGQSFADFELILVDDGSPDHCPAICDEYAAKDSRVVVIHQENGGLSAARNAGIDWSFASSDSQWLTFIDSDDWVHPEYLKILHGAVLKTGCKLAVCGLLRTKGEELPDISTEVQVEQISADEFYCNRAGEYISPAAACAKLYSKEQFANLRFPVGKLHEDEFTTYQTVYQAGEVAMCTERLYAYYTNPDGIMHTQWSPRRMDSIEAYEQQFAYAKNAKNEMLSKRVLYLMVFNLTLQCISVQKQIDGGDSECGHYRKYLQRKLRNALKSAKPYDIFPLSAEKNHWIYYQAYPNKMIWRNRFRRLFNLKGAGSQ